MKKILVVNLFIVGNTSADLVGHWLFDEGEGTLYADSSPNGNDAIIANSPIWSTDVPTTGFANAASLDLDGAGRYIDTAYPGIAGNAARTVAFWIKTTTAGNHGIVAWGNSTNNGTKWHVRLNDNANNGPVGAIRTETQGDFTIGSTSINDGNWHHVASVYPEGGGELGTVIHYVDGVAEAPGGNGGSTQPVNTSVTADPVTVGRRNQGGLPGYFPGQLDDVRIYDRALSAPEVAQLSAAAPTTDGLVMHFPLDEGSGTLAADLGSGDNDGTLIDPTPIAPTWSNDAPDHLSHSLLFANNNDLLRTDYEGIGGTASRSVTFWFKTSLTFDNGILGWGNAAGDGLKWHARLNTAAADGPVGALRLEIQNGRTVATTPANDGLWHHGAIVFEEDADPDISDVVFYLDGELDPVDLFTSVPIDTQNTGGPFAVTLGGRLQGGAIRGFEGNLADLRIYDSGLTQAEVREIMSGGMTGGGDLAITSLEYTPGDPGSATITWQSRPGRSYRIESSPNLEGNWQEEEDFWESQGATTSYTVSGIPAGTPKLFFRVAEE
ncbi:hypothetical protein N9C66_05885 [Akkermansiaceae bacterium]|nr:hypothetical protein [Akkermansiaceae bacterium]MDB4393471.1 hypothetical protein [bacterium]MDA7892280.1 hypothetical protein [Akkermansiaceae bacterium]MDA7934652.1 hypothetical protein [Akkermansiaceae bacterium]MDA9830851.1 hypothetical protein [Akkermansiaceae bacterium]